jgi:hypothetical protein
MTVFLLNLHPVCFLPILAMLFADDEFSPSSCCAGRSTMARIGQKDPRPWVTSYERSVDRASILICARSSKDRALLHEHAQRLDQRLTFWKAWR